MGAKQAMRIVIVAQNASAKFGGESLLPLKLFPNTSIAPNRDMVSSSRAHPGGTRSSVSRRLRSNALRTRHLDTPAVEQDRGIFTSQDRRTYYRLAQPCLHPTDAAAHCPAAGERTPD